MGPWQNRLLVLMLIGALVLFDNTEQQGAGECFQEGSINFFSFNYTNVGSLLIVEGRVEVCNSNGEYESVCDIGWDTVEAHLVCSYFFIDYVPEALTGLGFPRRRYSSRTYNCSENDFSLRGCNYSSSIDPECNNGPHVAGVRCTEVCRDGEMNLDSLTSTFEGDLNTYSGRVEICVNRTFHSVCDVGWDSRDAQVACNNHFPGRNFIAEVHPSFPLPPGTRYVEDFMCNGIESSLSQCSYSPPTSPECHVGNHSAAVVCREVCTEGMLEFVNSTVRFDSGLRSFSAVVQVCVNGQYGYICADNWDNREADVVCRSYARVFQHPYYVNTALTSSVIPTDAPIYRYSMCNGTESRFDSCQLPRSDSNSTCPSIGTVNCTEVISQCFSEGRFRVINTTSRSSFDGSITIAGRIELCANSTYISLCDYYWNPVDAQVYCRYFLSAAFGVPALANITAQPIPGSQYGYSRAGIAPYNVICNGSESRLEDCRQSTASSSFCDDPTTSAAGVLCSYSASAPTLPPTSTAASTLPPTSTTPTVGDRQIPQSFLPFGPDHGDLTAPADDDGSTGEIILGTDVVIFGSRHDRLYVNTNGVLSFGTSYTSPTSTDFTFLSSPPIIAPFWDDINIVRGGTIYYRQDSNSTVMELVQKALVSEYPEAASFQPSLVFVATWDRVEQFGFSDTGRVNTFQVVIASDGTRTFVRFNYGDIQWGGGTTVIGVTAGDRVNFITHPASQSTAVLMLYNTTTTYMYRFNGAPPPIGVQGMCSVIVWYSPAVQFCEAIRGYEVRLYNPQSPRLNVTNRVGANGTFYIVDVDELVSREETYVQVRAIHSIGVGEWSEGTSLGCEKPVTTEMPIITTETPPRVYFELNGKTYHNNSAVSVSDIGEGTSALYCRTDKEECCGTVPNRFGQFYYPNGVQVPINARGQGFYRNRGSQLIRLNRREGITSPTGTYRCEIPNADDETVKIYITLTE